MEVTKRRCEWVTDEAIYIRYHDEEWGAFEGFKDDAYLFEMLILEGAQAGLSWITILRRRENYRHAFAGFDPVKVSRFDDAKIAALLQDKGIIRNKRKVHAAVKNAQAFLRVQEKYGSFHAFLSQFFDVLPVYNQWESHADLPAKTPESEALSKELKKYGFSFVGPVICYAFMQAVGMVNDHTTNCYLHKKEDVKHESNDRESRS